MTRDNVEKLKENWKRDPCWDIYDTEGFEEYQDELSAFQDECEAEWQALRDAEEQEEKELAEKLGLHGLYKLILQTRTLQERHDGVIDYLINGNTNAAWRAKRGYV